MTAKTQFSAHRFCCAPLMDRSDNKKINGLEGTVCAACAVKYNQLRETLCRLEAKEIPEAVHFDATCVGHNAARISSAITL